METTKSVKAQDSQPETVISTPAQHVRPKGVPEHIQFTVTHSGKVVLRSPFYGYGKYVWSIYPDYWEDRWGRIPLFGYVSADDKFTAERVAYDVGLVHRNDTFKPKPVKAIPKRVESLTETTFQ